MELTTLITTIDALGLTPLGIAVFVALWMIGYKMGIFPKWNGKKNGDSQKDIMDEQHEIKGQLKNIRENHFHGINNKLDELMKEERKGNDTATKILYTLENIRDNIK